MPPRGSPADVRYRQVQLVGRQVAAAVQAIWRALTPSRIEEELAAAAGQRIVAAVAAGQLSVAAGAQAFVAAAMAAQGAPAVAPAGVLAATALAGVASDGRPLETLLFLPALTVSRRRAAGASDEEAMLAGLAQMAMLTGTQISDAARAADQVASVADRRVVAYTRVVHLPACARCIVLSGQQYSVSEGFRRHPSCDCSLDPLSDVEWRDVRTPQELFEQMDADQQRRVFGPAGAEAIREGADVGQVVNARRGMNTATGTTTEGVTRRGIYGRQQRRAGGDFTRGLGARYGSAVTPRLMPEEILRQAGSRDEAISLLRQHAYLL